MIFIIEMVNFELKIIIINIWILFRVDLFIIDKIMQIEVTVRNVVICHYFSIFQIILKIYCNRLTPSYVQRNFQLFLLGWLVLVMSNIFWSFLFIKEKFLIYENYFIEIITFYLYRANSLFQLIINCLF
jgi:hypothetical protein